MTNNPDRKVCSFGQETREKLSAGINKGAEIVASTLGPGAKNVIIERKFRTPIVVDDGISAIENYILEDELENLGVTSLVDGARKASEKAGDGTSTTIILTKSIYNEGSKFIGGGLSLGKSSIEIKKQISEEKNLALAELDKITSQIKTKEDIRKVAIAAYDDEKMADVVSDMIYNAGENGIVIVEEAWGRETETEFIKGMKFAGKIAHGFFANTPDHGLKLERIPILVTDFDFVNLNDIFGIVNEVANQGEEGLIVVANKFENAALKQTIESNVFNIQNKKNFKVSLVKTPSFTPDEFEDLAIFLGAKYFSKERGDKITEANLGDLGRADNFQISQEGDGIAIGGEGNKEEVKKRLEWVKERLAKEKVKQIKAVLQNRVASLAARVGFIRVGSPSEAETEHIRLKTRNAVKSCQSALAEGVVPGGGLALKQVSEKLPDGILKEAIQEPYRIIQKNAGGKIEIPDIYDSKRVIKTALEQACSQAWLLINTDTAIAFRSQPDFKDAMEVVAEVLKNKK